MSKRILIEHRGGEREIALLEDRRLLFFSREKRGVRAEQIYLGAAERMMKGMEAAFVRIGRDQSGFLPFSECPQKPVSGEKMLVQVKKPPMGDKAPYLTRDLSLAGRYVILTPMQRACGVSKKITDEEARGRLLSLARRIAPEGMGLVMRTEALDAPEETLAAEAGLLLEKWQGIRERAEKAVDPCLIEDREDDLSRLLRDEHGSILEILADQDVSCPGGPPVRLCPDPFALYGVEGKLEKSRQRKVWLDCGGYLVIDKTEALTVIDVNSGKFTGGKAGAEQTFLALNLEAARETARLMRLNNMGGIILVDFVDMQAEENRKQVLRAMEDALRDDPVKCVVHGFSHLGLLEMTRKKTEISQSYHTATNVEE